MTLMDLFQRRYSYFVYSLIPNIGGIGFQFSQQQFWDELYFNLFTKITKFTIHLSPPTLITLCQFPFSHFQKVFFNKTKSKRIKFMLQQFESLLAKSTKINCN